MRYTRTWRIAKFAAWAALAIAALGLLVTTLWNSLIPELFGGPAITFWQALGLLVLMRVLFMGLRPRWGYRGGPAGNWQKKNSTQSRPIVGCVLCLVFQTRPMPT